MDNIRQKSWFSITGYVLITLSVMTLILFFAETFFPSQSSNLFPLQPDRITRWLFHSPPGQTAQKTTAAANTAKQENLFIGLNKKMAVGEAEFIYRGLAGPSEFKIDVIIPELDPQVSYPYRFTISEAKKSFRMANRNYQLIFAKKAALKLKQIK